MKLNGIILSFAVLPVAFIAGRRSGGSSSGGSQPRPSPTSNNTPNRTPSSSNNGPSSNFASGFRPTSSQVGRTNPSPDFKPVNPSGAPTSASGGGGYYSSQSGSSSRAGLGGTGSLIAAGAGGFLIGSFPMAACSDLRRVEEVILMDPATDVITEHRRRAISVRRKSRCVQYPKMCGLSGTKKPAPN